MQGTGSDSIAMDSARSVHTQAQAASMVTRSSALIPTGRKH